MKTYVDGLYVCDASVLPVSPGKPPILTILAFKGLDYKNGPIIESVGYIFIMILSRFKYYFVCNT